MYSRRAWLIWVWYGSLPRFAARALKNFRMSLSTKIVMRTLVYRSIWSIGGRSRNLARFALLNALPRTVTGRVIALGQRGHEILKEQLETVLRFHRTERRRGGLLAQNQFDFGDHLRHNTRVGPQCLGHVASPVVEALLALREQLLDKAPEGLNQCAKGDIAHNLVELPGEEVASLTNDRFREFLDQRGLPDARIAADQQQGALAVTGLVECVEERGDLPVPPVKSLGDDQPVGDVFAGEWKSCHAAGD